MKFSIEYLDWDSNFFDLSVGKIQDDLSEVDLNLALNAVYDRSYDLVYYKTQNLLENFHHKKFSALLADTKVPFKKIVGPKKIHPCIQVFKEEYPSKDLIRLARLAGKHSRYNLDPNISREKFEELYKIWIEKSVKGSMATHVITYKIEEKVLGFATILIDGLNGYAPLFAVDRESEGKGISFALMDAVESFMYNYGCKYLVSSTQGVNKKALKIYERFGCKFEKETYIYHLWRKK